MLGNWMFFWNTADWVTGPPPTPTPPDPGAGGGGRGHQDDDYWNARAEMMARFVPRETPPAARPGKAKTVQRTVENHNRILERVISGQASMLELGAAQRRLAKLSLQIDQFELDSEDEILAMILLS